VGANFVKAPDGACECDAGYYLNGTVCAPCSHNAWKSVPGNFDCSNCTGNARIPADQRPGTSPDMCQCLGEHQIGAFCHCASGYFLNATFCIPCSTYSFKESVGNAECFPCPVHASVPLGNQPGRNKSSCRCPINSELSDDESACRCKPGYRWNQSTEECLQCLLSQYKPDFGDGPCFNCLIRADC